MGGNPNRFPVGGTGLIWWTYLIGLEDGSVKLGRTSRPRRRFGEHKGRHGLAIAWVHLFPGRARHRVYAQGAEQAALQELANLGCRVGRTEFIQGVSKQVAISVVRKVVERYFDEMDAWEAESRRKEALREAELAAWRVFRANYVPPQAAPAGPSEA